MKHLCLSIFYSFFVCISIWGCATSNNTISEQKDESFISTNSIRANKSSDSITSMFESKFEFKTKETSEKSNDVLYGGYKFFYQGSK